MKPGATCEVWLDGVRIPDTPDTLAADYATALDGLRITWGRDGPNEQPSPATCTVELLDRAPASDFLSKLYVGADLRVWAEGEIRSDSDTWLQTMDDGTVDSWPLGDVTASRVAAPTAGTVTVIDAPSQGRAMRNALAPGAADTGVIVPPRVFSPAGQLPTAWDDIPTATAGDTWQLQTEVRAPAGCSITVTAVGFTSPYATAPTIGPQSDAVAATGGRQRVDYAATIPAALAGLWIGLWVRVTGVNRITWAGQTTTWAAAVGAWADQMDAVYVDNLYIGAPPAATETRRILAFAGNITDVAASPAGGGALYLKATAADQGSTLGNTVIGDDPWLAQTVAARADRITELAGITTTPRVRIDPPLDALQVSWRDVDAQPAYPLLQDLAQSAGGVMWAAVHAITGPFLWIENPQNRAAVRTFTETAGGVVIIEGAELGVVFVSAHDLLEDPVTWGQDIGDVINVVAVSWLEQTLGDEGEPSPTERTVIVPAVQPSTPFRLSVSTELTSESDAAAMANRLLGQALLVGWRLDGLVMDTGANLPDRLPSVDSRDRQLAFLQLLDGTARMGAAVTLTDMPSYAPRGSASSVYVEGGDYTYTAGAWVLTLRTSPSAGQGQSATWAELDWSWDQADPDIRWADTIGVTA